MKIVPINRIAFNGRTVNFSLNNSIEDIKKMDGYYPDSTIEKVLGTSHKIPKEKIYFADPMEFVNNDLKHSVDYVIYDNVPSYPEIEDIRKNYMGTNRTNYRKKFENIRDFYYRSEMSRYTNSNEAKYQQWQAAECIRLYDIAGDLRYKKETAEDEIKSIDGERYNIKAGLMNTKKELESQICLKKSLEMHLKHLKALNEQTDISAALKQRMILNENIIYSVVETKITDNKHSEFQKNSLQNSAYYNEGIEAYPYDTLKYGKYANTEKVYDSVKKLMEEGYCIGASKGIYGGNKLSLSETIDKFENILKENSSLIDEMHSYIGELQSKIVSIDEKITLKKSYIESCKEKLAPLFEELKAYYLKQGIKVIKK